MIGVEPYEIQASGALFLLVVIVAITLISWATRPRQGDVCCASMYGWVWCVIAAVFGGGAVLLVAAVLLALWLFYPYTPGLG